MEGPTCDAVSMLVSEVSLVSSPSPIHLESSLDLLCRRHGNQTLSMNAQHLLSKIWCSRDILENVDANLENEMRANNMNILFLHGLHTLHDVDVKVGR